MNLRSSISAIFLFCVSLFCARPFAISAQELQVKADSLKQALSSAQSDQVKYDICIELADIYSLKFVDSLNTLKYVNEGLALGRRNDNERWQLRILRYKGIINGILGHLEVERNLFDSIINRAREIGYQEAVGNSYNNLGASHYFAGDPKTALPYQEQALEIHLGIKNNKGLSLTYFNLGNIHRVLGNSEQALQYFEKTLDIRTEMDDQNGIANVETSIGNYYYTIGEFDQALSYFLRASETFQKLGDSRGILLIYNNIGLVYEKKGDYSRALIYYHKFLDYEQSHTNNARSNTLGNIGILYQKQGEYEKALDYLTRFLNSAKQQEDDENIAHAYGNIGRLYQVQRKDSLALLNYERSISYIEKVGNEGDLYFVYTGIAEIYINAGSTVKARTYLEKSLEISSRSKDKQNISTTKVLMGAALLHEGKLLEARREVQEGVSIAKSIDLPLIIRDGAEQLAKIETQLGNYKSAYEALALFKQMDDSLKNIEEAKEIVRLQSEFEFGQEKQQIEAENEKNLLLRDQELQRQQLIMVIGIILVLALIAVGVLVARFRIRSKAQEADKLKEIGRFKEAMTGMIAHDLKNPLSVLKLRTASDPPSQAMTAQMLHLVTNMLDVQKLEAAAMPIERKPLTLSELVMEAGNQVNPLLAEKNVKLQVDIDPYQSVLADKDLLQRVFTNLLTNAIKYSPLNSEIKVDSSLIDRRVKVAVHDQGPGISEEQLASIFDPFGQHNPLDSGGVASTGLGLTFCKLVLQAHGSDIEVDSIRRAGATFFFELEATSGSEEDQRNGTSELVMSQEDREAIIAAIPSLKQFQLHQAVEMEEVLEPLIQTDSEAVKIWVESVLNAAYAGNEESFEELLAEME